MAAAPAPRLSRLAQIAMRATDLSRAVPFYRDVLGVPFLFDAPNLAFFDCGGVRLMLGPAEGAFDHPGSILYFATPDIGAAHAALAEKGVRFTGEPHVVAKLPDREVWLAFFEDTEGNTLALMEERRVQASPPPAREGGGTGQGS